MTFSHQTKLWFQSWQIAFSEKNDPPVTTVLPADTAFKHRGELTQTSWGEPWNGVVLADLCNRGADSCVLSSLTLLLSRENRAQKCSDFGFLSPAGFANVIPIFMTCSAEFLLYSLLYSLKTATLWTFLAYLKPLKFHGTGLKCQHYVFVWLLFKSPNRDEGMAQ